MIQNKSLGGFGSRFNNRDVVQVTDSRGNVRYERREPDFLVKYKQDLNRQMYGNNTSAYSKNTQTPVQHTAPTAPTVKTSSYTPEETLPPEQKKQVQNITPTEPKNTILEQFNNAIQNSETYYWDGNKVAKVTKKELDEQAKNKQFPTLQEDPERYVHGGLTKKQSEESQKKRARQNLDVINYVNNKKNAGLKLSKDDLEQYNRASDDYATYKLLTDPIGLETLYDYAEQNEKELKSKEMPQDYFGRYVGNFTTSAGIVYQNISYAQSKHATSAFSTYLIRSNKTQSETAQGKVNKAAELGELSNKSRELLNTAKQILEVEKELSKFDNISDESLTLDQYKIKSNLSVQKFDLLNKFKELKEYAKRLESWSPQTIGDTSWLYVQKFVDKAVSGTLGLFSDDAAEKFSRSYQDLEQPILELPMGSSVYGGSWIDNLEKLLNEDTNDDKRPKSGGSFFGNLPGAKFDESGNYIGFKKSRSQKISDIINETSSRLNSFEDRLSNLTKAWNKEKQDDIQDIIDWKTGNNWLGFHAKVDDYYEAQEQLANANGMKPYSMQTLLFGTAGLAGASNSSWYKSIASIGSKLVGLASGSASVSALAGAVSFMSDQSSSSDENNAEVAQMVRDKLSRNLKREGLYDYTLKEAEEWLNRNKSNEAYDTYQKIKQGIKTGIFTEQDLVNYLLDCRLSGVIPTSDNDIQKQTANAVIGSNGAYEADFIATSGDNIVDAILTCAPTSAIWEGSKLVLGKGVNKAGKLITKTQQKIGKLEQKFALDGSSNAGMFVTNEMFKKPIPNITSDLGIKTPKWLGNASNFVKEKAASFMLNHGLKMQAWGAPVAKAFGKVALGVSTEMNEEATQNAVKNDFESGYFDNQTKQPFMSRLYEDFFRGVPVVADYWCQGKLNGLSNDPEMQANMNGAIILSLPMNGVYSVPVAIQGVNKNLSITEAIMHNMNAGKQADRSKIDQNILYVKNSSGDRYKQTLDIMQTYSRLNKILAESQEGRDVRDNDMAIPQEYVDEQIQTFKKIAAVSNNPLIKSMGVRTGLLKGFDSDISKSDKYQKFVSIYSLLNDKLEEGKIDLNDAEQSKKVLTTMFSEDLDIYESVAKSQLQETSASQESEKETKDEDEKQTESLEQRIDKLKSQDDTLSQIAELMRIINDYNNNDKDNIIVRHANQRLLKLIEKANREFGLNITESTNIDDIINMTINKNAFNNLYEAQKDITMRQINVDYLNGIFKEFKKNPLKYIEQYEDSVKTDKELEKFIEKDYNDRVDEYIEIQRYDVNEGDVYTSGSAVYKVIKDGEDSNGNPIYKAKVLQNVNDQSQVGKIVPFNKATYYRSKKSEQDSQEAKQKEKETVAEKIVVSVSEETKDEKREVKKPVEDEDGNIKLEDKDQPFDKPTSENVSVEYWQKPWRNDKSKSNRTARVYIKGKEDKGYFELVKDTDFKTGKENNQYSVHFKPTDEKNPHAFTDEEKKELFDALNEMIPQGSEISTWAGKESGITKGGIHGLDRFFNDYGYEKVGERNGYTKDGKKIKLPIYRKPISKTFKADETEDIDQTDEQKSTLEILQKKREGDKKEVLWNKNSLTRTGHDYFIKYKNKITRFLRVHAILENRWGTKIQTEKAAQKLQKELESLQNANDDYKSLKARIIELEKETKQQLKERFGENSTAYRHHVAGLDFSPYLRDTQIKDPSVPQIIAELVHRDIPGASVISGTIIDEICRAFFNGEEIYNKPEYMMTDSVFKKLVHQLQIQKDEFDRRGWILDTTPYVWHATLPNGRRVAGETDMIAIDKDGKIHIIDFKTTAQSVEKRLMYKQFVGTDDDLHEVWVTADSSTVIPEDAEIKESSDYIESVINDSDTTQVQNYAEQLTIYQMMIEGSDPNLEVADINLLAIQIDKTYDEDDYSVLKSIDSIKDSELINLTELDQVQDHISNINKKFRKRPDTLSKDQILSLIQDLQTAISNTKKLIKPLTNQNLLRKAKLLLAKEEALLEKLNKIKSDNKLLQDIDYVDQIKDDCNNLIRQHNELSNKIDEDAERNHGSQSSSSLLRQMFGERKGSKSGKAKAEDVHEYIPSKDDVEEDVDEEDTDDWRKHNNIAGLRGTVTGRKKDSLFKRLSRFLRKDRSTNSPAPAVNDNLITNGKFKIFHKIIGGKLRLFVNIKLGSELFGDEAGFIINDGYDSETGTASKLCKNLRIQYYRLMNQLKPGQIIVATKVSRTNGIMIYGKDRTLFGDAALLGKDNEKLQQLFDSSDEQNGSLIGIAGPTGVYRIDSDGLSVKDNIYVYKDSDSEYMLDPEEEDYDNPNAIEEGTIVFLHKFRYQEDPEGTYRVIPIPLKPVLLSKSEIDFIIDTLKNKSMGDQFEAVVKNSDGTTSKKKVKNFTNERVLKMLVRFGGAAEKMGNTFVFDYKRNKRGVPMPNVVEITDLRDPNRSVISLRLDDDTDLATLRQILQLTSIHCNAYNKLRQNVNGNADSYHLNPYLELIELFQGKKNEDVESIQLTEHLSFDRSDMSTKENPNVGLTGAAWMIKHGILQTNFAGLENPLISIEELGIEQAESDQEESVYDNIPEYNNFQEEKPKNKEEKSKNKDEKPKRGRTKKSDGDGETGSKSANRRRRQAVYDEEYNDDEIGEEYSDEDGEAPVITLEEFRRAKKRSENKEEKPKKSTTSTEDVLNAARGKKRKRSSGPAKIIDAKEISENQADEKAVVKHLTRIFGKKALTIKWYPDVIEMIGTGKAVVGRMMGDIIELSKKMPEGTEFHEAFHRIMDIMLPIKIRQKIENRIAKKYNLKQDSEELFEFMADQYMDFRNGVEKAYDPGFLHILKNIKSYVDALKSVRDWQLALLYSTIDSGVFRFIKPNKKAVDKFHNVYGGVRNFVLQNPDTKEIIEFDQFNSFTGRRIFNELLDYIVRNLLIKNNISLTGDNAYKLRTDLDTIKHIREGKNGENFDEKSGMSSWYKYMTGSYIQDGVDFNRNDAVVYLELCSDDVYYKIKDEAIDDLKEHGYKGKTADEIVKEHSDDFEDFLENEIMVDYVQKTESSKNDIEQLEPIQRMMNQVMDNFDTAQKFLEKRFKNMNLNSRERKNEESDEDSDEPNGEPNQTSAEIDQHKDTFYDHSRITDLKKQLAFFLSTITDERFATADDVENGRCRGVIGEDGIVRNQDGTRTRMPIGTRMLNLIHYVPLKDASTKLLINCYHVQTVNELLDTLKELGQDDAFFYNIYRRVFDKNSKSIEYYEDGQPIIYIQNGENVELYKQGTYHQFTDENGNVSFIDNNTGEAIENAQVLINHTNESLITQLLQYVSCQRLEFDQTYIQNLRDERGQIIDDQFTIRMQNTDTSYGSTLYPKQWFRSFISSNRNIFKIKDGKYSFTSRGKSKLKNSITNIYNIVDAMSKKKSSVIIGSNEYEINNPEHLQKIIKNFVASLNTLGIDIDVDEFKFFLKSLFRDPSAGDKNIKTLFGKFCSSNDQKCSMSKFISTLRHIEQQLIKKEKPNFAVLTESSAEKGIRSSKKNEYLAANGLNMFTDSSVIKELASAKLRYRKLMREASTMGPGNKKRFTMAQRNTASDITDDLSNGEVVVDDEGNVSAIGSNILNDMVKYIYTCFAEVDKHGMKKIYGSLIAKQMFANGKNKPILKLAQHGGSRTEQSRQGGKAYTEMSDREDLISKISILMENGILFPTLSDKATYFYLKGITLAGLNYKNINGTSEYLLPLVTGGKDAIYYDFEEPNDVLDQLVEYAICEHKAIRQNLDKQKGKQSILDKIKNFSIGTNNSVRYGFMTEVYTFDENGKATFHPLDNVKQKAEKNYELAEQLFFGPNVTDAQRRRSVAYALQQRVIENLNGLVEAGILEHKGNDALTGYSNIGLDADIVDDLTEVYMSKIVRMSKDKDLSEETRNKLKSVSKRHKDAETGKMVDNKKLYEVAHSMAIVAIVNDLVSKSIQSEEEVSRYYTGVPQFFKWFYGTVSYMGKTYEGLTDRYSDQSKRHGGLGSTGDLNRTDFIGIPKEYKCAEAKDPRVVSEYLNYIHEAFDDSEYRRAYFDKYAKGLTYEEQCKLADQVYGEDKIDLSKIKEDFTDENEKSAIELSIQQKTSSYTEEGDFGEADGAAYITPKMTEHLLRMRGAFNEEVAIAFAILDGSIGSRIQMYNELATKFEKLANEEKDKQLKRKYLSTAKQFKSKAKSQKKYLGDYMSNAKAYKIITEALIGSQKYSAYGYRMQNGIPAHYYDKFALFPLFRSMTTGFMTDILDKMEDRENNGENGIDMLMMDDGVKVGGCGAQSMSRSDFEGEDGIQKFKDFKFNIYSQKFQFIRRQMNTDPHEDRTRSMGTQVAKIALAGIISSVKYVTKDGTMRGVELVSRIMNSINKLAEIGEHRIEEKFFTDGEFDFEKTGRFLYEQLDNREADENLLDGLTVVTKNGKKMFKIPIDASSSSSWMESIIAAIVNKFVVDIQTPGNAYYQRSIFGHEGRSLRALHDKEGKLLYNGETLKALNDDGSMDAVISIDYFVSMGILPKELQNNFNDAKQWLIDHNIIGKNATATTVGYRIPTQAQSSIHPLRFVDVLPVVRDTIILPKDFTAITGSDFDIDKLYLYTANFNEDASTDYNLIENPQSEDDYKNNERFYQNRLIFDYIAALKTAGKIDGKYESGPAFTENYGSVDEDTQLPRRVLDRIEKSRKAKRFGSFQAGSLIYQAKIKAAFLVGKVGIGPFALNNNSQILTQLYGVKFKTHRTDESTGKKYKTILECMNASSLANNKDKRGKRILGWLSGFINAHVDVAKDPWIGRLNVNKFTWSLTCLLTRIGLSDGTLLFTSQPIMVEMAKIANENSGEYMNDLSMSESQRINKEITDFAKKAFIPKGSESQKALDTQKFNSNTDDSAETEQRLGIILSELLGIDKDGNYTGKNILEDILTSDEAKIDPDKDISFNNLSDERIYYLESIDYPISPKEVQFYVYCAYKSLNKYQDALSDLVNVTKIDTKKQGKNLVEQVAYKRKYDEFVKNAKDGSSVFESEGIVAMFEGGSKDPSIPNESFIGFKTDTATSLYRRIMSGFSIQAQPWFLSLHLKIMNEIGYDASNKTVSSQVSRAIMKFIKSSFFYNGTGGWFYRQGIKPKDLIIGNKTVQDKLECVQNSIKSEMEDEDGNLLYERYGIDGKITNPILKALQADIYQDRYGESEHYKFITLENSLLDDRDDVNDLEQAWDELYQDEDTVFEMGDETFTMKQFATELIAYAFLTSADESGQTKFFKYVPNTWREESGYADYMQSILDGTFDINSLSGRGEDYIIDEILLNNWQNDTFVKEFKFKTKQKKDNAIIYTDNQGDFEYTDKWEWYNSRTKKKQKSSIKRNIPYAFAAIGEREDGDWNTKVVTIRENRYNDNEFPRFVRVKRPDAQTYDSNSYLLYRLSYVDERTTYRSDGSEKSTRYPIYTLVMPKGKMYRAGSYTYNITQYTDDHQYEQAYTKSSRYGNHPTKNMYKLAVSTFMDYISDLIMSGVEFTEEVVKDIPRVYWATANERYHSNLHQGVGANILFEIAKNVDILSKDQYKKIKKIMRNLYGYEDKSEKKEKKAKQKHDDYSILSGKNIGLDNVWKKIAGEYGVKFKSYSKDSVKDAKEAKKHANKANKTLKRAVSETILKDWLLVKHSDQIIAITDFDDNENCKGHSGWVTQMAIDEGKPVYVYSIEDKHWYTLVSDEDGEHWESTQAPILTKNTATVSDNVKSKEAEEAIRQVFENTFDKQEQDDDEEFDKNVEETCTK